MDMIFVLIILAIILLIAAVFIFFWAVKNRQFDDLEIHAYQILDEDTFEDAESKTKIEANADSKIS